MEQPETSKPKKPYEKPRVDSHRVFEVSLACVKHSGIAQCMFNIHLFKS
ncbi:MAG TPA: hypothetical protein V6D47_17135 [Oscillatoriaceae cyanobacterium]